VCRSRKGLEDAAGSKRTQRSTNEAARVLRFGPPNVMINDDVPRPEPVTGQLLVRLIGTQNEE
jgi:hypothetical protein